MPAAAAKNITQRRKVSAKTSIKNLLILHAFVFFFASLRETCAGRTIFALFFIHRLNFRGASKEAEIIPDNLLRIIPAKGERHSFTGRYARIFSTNKYQ